MVVLILHDYMMPRGVHTVIGKQLKINEPTMDLILRSEWSIIPENVCTL